MTTLANLLTRKQKLVDRLQENPGSSERDEIQCLIAQINTVCPTKNDLLNEAKQAVFCLRAFCSNSVAKDFH